MLSARRLLLFDVESWVEQMFARRSVRLITYALVPAIASASAVIITIVVWHVFFDPWRADCGLGSAMAALAAAGCWLASALALWVAQAALDVRRVSQGAPYHTHHVFLSCVVSALLITPIPAALVNDSVLAAITAGALIVVMAAGTVIALRR